MRMKPLAWLIAIPALLAFRADDFPSPSVAKKLYAKRDFRGKALGKLVFGKTISGPEITPEALKGKVLLIDLWATWCGPCRELIPELNAWKAKFGNDLVIVGISDEKPEVVTGFLAKTKQDYTVTTDEAQTMSKRLGVEGIPHVVVVSQDGIVRYQGWPQDPADRLTTEKLAQIIAANRSVKSAF